MMLKGENNENRCRIGVVDIFPIADDTIGLFTICHTKYLENRSTSRVIFKGPSVSFMKHQINLFFEGTISANIYYEVFY